MSGYGGNRRGSSFRGRGRGRGRGGFGDRGRRRGGYSEYRKPQTAKDVLAKVDEFGADGLDAGTCCFLFQTMAKSGEPASRWSKNFKWGKLMSALSSHVPFLRSRQITVLWWSVARLAEAKFKPSEYFQERLQQRTLEILQEMDTMGLVHIVHAHAKANMHLEDPLRGEVMDAMCGVAGKMNTQDIANVLWSFAKMHGKGLFAGAVLPQDLMPALSDRAGDVLRSAKGMELANIVWAAGNLGEDMFPFNVERQMGSIETCAMRNVQYLKPQHIIMLMDGISKLKGELSDHLTRTLIDCIARDVSSLSPQNASSALFLFAQLGNEIPMGLVSRACEIVPFCNAEDIVSISSALYAVKTSDEGAKAAFETLTSAIENWILDDSSKLKSSGIARVLHGFSAASISFRAETLDKLLSTAFNEMGTFSKKDVQMSWKALAALGQRLPVPLKRALVSQTIAVAPAFTARELSTCMMGIAKMQGKKQLAKRGLVEALMSRLGSVAGMLLALELSNLVWAFGKLEMKDTEAAVLFSTGAKLAGEMNHLDVSNSLVGLASMTRSEGVFASRDKFHSDLIQRLSTVGASLGAQQLAQVSWALAKLSCNHASLLKKVYSWIKDCMSDFHAQNVGMVAWSLSVLNAAREVPAKVVKALRKRAKETAGDMTWQTCGLLGHFYANTVVKSFDLGNKWVKVMKRVNKRAMVTIEDVNSAAEAENSAPATYMGSSAESGNGRRCLVVDDGGALSATLQKRGWKVRTWNRFSGSSCEGAAWPSNELGNIHAAFLRIHMNADAFIMGTHAAASSLCVGGQIFVFGTFGEGIADASRRLKQTGLFDTVREESMREGMMIVSAKRAKGTQVKGQLSAWRQVDSIALGDFKVDEWTTYPGLFAGGRIDIMTTALLERLPTFTSKSILDFCSGSGTIGAFLQSKYPSAKVTLLDADAIALHAAARNMESSRKKKAKCILSDCFADMDRDVPRTKTFDWIVSNPPVHRNKANDFAVCVKLAKGHPPTLNREVRSSSFANPTFQCTLYFLPTLPPSKPLLFPKVPLTAVASTCGLHGSLSVQGRKK